MLPTFCFAVMTALGQQNRTFSFLAYQDTMFAIRIRDVWGQPTRETEIPRSQVDLTSLGVDHVLGRRPGRIEQWDNRASCINVICGDFDHVLGWYVTPHFPKVLTRPKNLTAEIQNVARRILKDKEGLVPISFSTPNAFSTDLDASGKQEILVDISVETKNRTPNWRGEVGMTFLYVDPEKPIVLSYIKDGWPRVLSIVDLDNDRKMEIIVGGVTSVGKYVQLYKYQSGRAISRALYQGSQ